VRKSAKSFVTSESSHSPQFVGRIQQRHHRGDPFLLRRSERVLDILPDDLLLGAHERHAAELCTLIRHLPAAYAKLSTSPARNAATNFMHGIVGRGLWTAVTTFSGRVKIHVILTG
jgi:hypothetical protein